ncbi:MAG: hypothetical protein WC800_01865 [Candidatus Nanopelagicaceae bacterium]
MTQYKLEIFEDDSGSWTGLANLGSDIEPETYRVLADSLEELRELVQEGVNGDLGIEGISFEEVYSTRSEATS